MTEHSRFAEIAEHRRVKPQLPLFRSRNEKPRIQVSAEIAGRIPMRKVCRCFVSIRKTVLPFVPSPYR
jgi:hypothetical protein